MTRFLPLLAMLLLSACAADPAPEAKTSHMCPAYARNMNDVETALTAAGR